MSQMEYDFGVRVAIECGAGVGIRVLQSFSVIRGRHPWQSSVAVDGAEALQLLRAAQGDERRALN